MALQKTIEKLVTSTSQRLVDEFYDYSNLPTSEDINRDDIRRVMLVVGCDWKDSLQAIKDVGREMAILHLQVQSLSNRKSIFGQSFTLIKSQFPEDEEIARIIKNTCTLLKDLNSNLTLLENKDKWIAPFRERGINKLITKILENSPETDENFGIADSYGNFETEYLIQLFNKRGKGEYSYFLGDRKYYVSLDPDRTVVVGIFTSKLEITFRKTDRFFRHGLSITYSQHSSISGMWVDHSDWRNGRKDGVSVSLNTKTGCFGSVERWINGNLAWLYCPSGDDKRLTSYFGLVNYGCQVVLSTEQNVDVFWIFQYQELSQDNFIQLILKIMEIVGKIIGGESNQEFPEIQKVIGEYLL